MISRTALANRATLWELQHHIVERDYVIGWVLWGIGADRRLSDSWVFKGGTCLKKCYTAIPRFSQDLDFTVLPGGPSDPGELVPILNGLVERVYEESGIDFSAGEHFIRTVREGGSAEGGIYYKGPLDQPGRGSRIRLDITSDERVVSEPVRRPIDHPYPDDLPSPASVLCYSFAEVFAEKIRAMGDRSRPRDLYDIITLFRNRDTLPSPETVRSVYEAKCESKGLRVFTLDDLLSSPLLGELEGEWTNMLRRQLPDLPPFTEYWEEVPLLFRWFNG